MALPAFRTSKETWAVGRENGKYLRVITASAAKQVLREDKAKDRFPKSKKEYVRLVDRKLGAPEEAVKFGGRIIYQNNTATFEEALAWIANYIVLLSPRGIKRPVDKKLGGYRKEHYQDAHLYMVNGRSVMQVDGQTNIVSFKRSFQTTKHTKGSKHQFVNTMPYAKRIETGATTIKDGQFNYTKPWSYQAPTGVYKKVARAAKRRFGETVNIRYAVLKLNLGQTMQAAVKKGGTPSRMGQLYPVIVVRPKSITRGIT